MKRIETYRTIYKIPQLLKMVEEGEIQSPDFHRNYVWKLEDKIALLNSISNGFPIGSFVLWETEHSVKSKPTFGAYQIKLAQDSDISEKYLIDGYQRLSTLFNLFYFKKQKANEVETKVEFVGEPKDWNIFYDLKKEKFFFLGLKQIPLTHQFSLRNFFNTVSFLQLKTHLLSNYTEYIAEQYIRRVELLIHQFRNYEIPILQFLGEDELIATEIFKRINSTGKSLSKKEITLAERV